MTARCGTFDSRPHCGCKANEWNRGSSGTSAPFSIICRGHESLTLSGDLSMRMTIVAAALTVGLCITLEAQSTKVNSKKPDTAFAAMQERGKKAMGVDQ